MQLEFSPNGAYGFSIQSTVYKPAASAPPGNLLEMKTLRPNSTAAEPGYVKQDPHMIHILSVRIWEAILWCRCPDTPRMEQYCLWGWEGTGVACLMTSILEAIWENLDFARCKSKREGAFPVVLQPFFPGGGEGNFNGSWLLPYKRLMSAFPGKWLLPDYWAFSPYNKEAESEDLSLTLPPGKQNILEWKRHKIVKTPCILEAV